MFKLIEEMFTGTNLAILGAVLATVLPASARRAASTSLQEQPQDSSAKNPTSTVNPCCFRRCR